MHTATSRTRPLVVSFSVVGRVLVGALVGLGLGCQSDADEADAGRSDAATTASDAAGPPANLDKRPSVSAIDEGTHTALAAPEVPDEALVSVVIAEKARVQAPPREAVGGRNLAEALPGREGRITYGIDGDGDEDDGYTFLPDREEMAFLAWAEDGYCHLAWTQYGVARYVFSVCVPPAAPETFACNQSANGSRRCKRCVGVDCEPCDAQIKSAGVECVTQPPDAGPTPDAALPVDAGVDRDLGLPPEDGGPVDPGVCPTECMSQSGAVCCTTCGCQGEIRCLPECSPPFEWDCEMECCFDYEALECH